MVLKGVVLKSTGKSSYEQVLVIPNQEAGKISRPLPCVPGCKTMGMRKDQFMLDRLIIRQAMTCFSFCSSPNSLPVI